MLDYWKNWQLWLLHVFRYSFFRSFIKNWDEKDFIYIEFWKYCGEKLPIELFLIFDAFYLCIWQFWQSEIFLSLVTNNNKSKLSFILFDSSRKLRKIFSVIKIFFFNLSSQFELGALEMRFMFEQCTKKV